MKQAILNLKRKLLIVEFPEGATNIERSVIGDIIFKTSGTKEVVWLPNDRLVKQSIGKLTDITESQFAEWVNSVKLELTSYKGYYDYTAKCIDFRDIVDSSVSTAKESFFSYLEKEGVLFENPYEEPIVPDDEDNVMALELFKQWQEAESKVWDNDRIYVFEILN